MCCNLILEQYAAGYSFEEIVAEELLILNVCIDRPGKEERTKFLKCHSEEANKGRFNTPDVSKCSKMCSS